MFTIVHRLTRVCGACRVHAPTHRTGHVYTRHSDFFMRENQMDVARMHYAPRATLCRVNAPVRMVMGEDDSGLACAVPTILNRDPTCAGEPSQHLGNNVPGKCCVEMGIGSTLSGYPRCTHWPLDAAPSPCCLQLDFLEFRDVLFPASGFQSVQFRIVEVSESSYERDALALHGV